VVRPIDQCAHGILGHGCAFHECQVKIQEDDSQG
jgi:hypothetical protein